MKYVLFIGRYAPWHEGHATIVNAMINSGNPVCIAVRESEEKFSVNERLTMIEKYYAEKYPEKYLKDEIIVRQIPDISMVAIGRDVGYGIIEVPDHIKQISATKIRAGEMENTV